MIRSTAGLRERRPGPDIGLGRVRSGWGGRTHARPPSCVRARRSAGNGEGAAFKTKRRRRKFDSDLEKKLLKCRVGERYRKAVKQCEQAPAQAHAPGCPARVARGSDVLGARFASVADPNPRRRRRRRRHRRRHRYHRRRHHRRSAQHDLTVFLRRALAFRDSLLVEAPARRLGRFVILEALIRT